MKRDIHSLVFWLCIIVLEVAVIVLLTLKATGQ